MLKRWRYFLPLAIFLLLAIFLWRGLHLDPRKLPSTLINKPVPEFKLADLNLSGHFFTKQQLQGEVSLVNVWATWCAACQQEHPILLDIASTNQVKLYAIDYKDDWQAAKTWLATYGNPYQAVGFDKDGRIAIDWGVYGTPETFLIDKQGTIRYKHIGPLTKQVWTDILLPMALKLKATSS